MNEFFTPANGTDSTVEQVAARENYDRLRDRLVTLKSAAVPDFAAISAVVQALEKAQLAYKATHGLIGNNPLGDFPDNG